MKVAFFSNFLNHHQYPLCEGFLKNKNIQFVFVACSKIPSERVKMGYKDYTNHSFVVKEYEEKEVAEQIATTFDVCIFGANCEKYVELRMKKNLLTFRYIERIFKKGKWRYLIPQVRRKIKKQYLQYKNRKFYILCASGFTSSDLAFCGFPTSKCLQWGYFPEQSKHTFDVLLRKKTNSDLRIIYVGRLLKLKNVDSVIKAFRIVSKHRNNIRLDIVGDGPEASHLKKLASKRKNKIYFHGYKSIEETRQIIETSNILVLASNFYEGWGAVVNEAMTSACIPICSHSVGSAPVLINDGSNGFIFHKGNVKQLATKIDTAVENIYGDNSISLNAYNSIKTTWNANVAAARFYELCLDMLASNETKNACFQKYDNGPCSLAKNFSNNWYKKN